MRTLTPRGGHGVLGLLFVLLAGGAAFVSAAQHDGHSSNDDVDNAARTHDVHFSPRGLGSAWYHPDAHPVRALFQRGVPTPGSQEWMAQYPAVWAPPMPEAATPQTWLAALQAAEQAGRIPAIPVTTQSPNMNPTYGGQDPAGVGSDICSSTAQCRGPGDEWDAPDGHVAIGFDDGPSQGSAMLYQFLQAQNQSATHFMIGVNILGNYGLFNEAFSNLQNDIAVHTWTHPYMTTLNNTQVVAELGWTMQIIHDSTGGRVPRYWRPPYGDSDNRVRAIAKEVFGLTQIMWNKDSEDWSMASGATTLPKVVASLNAWYAGPKSPGLIVLEHELTNDTAGAFIQTYPSIAANSWTPVSTVQMFSGAYQNADDNRGAVLNMNVGGTVPTLTAKPTAAAAAVSSASLWPENTTTTSVSAGQNNNHNTNANGAAYVRRGGHVVLLLLGTLISVLW